MSTPRIQIYAWGANSHGQTGTNLPDAEELHQPTPVHLSNDLSRVLSSPTAIARLSASFPVAAVGGSTDRPPGGAGVTVTGGGGHSVLLVDGRVFTAGLNDAGQLGRDTGGTADGVFREVDVGEAVTSAACGWDHTLLLTASGRVLSAGSNKFGQRGLGATQPRRAGTAKVAPIATATATATADTADTAATATATATTTVTAKAKALGAGSSVVAAAATEVSAACPGFKLLPLFLDGSAAVSKTDDVTSQEKTLTSQDRATTSDDKVMMSRMDSVTSRDKMTSHGGPVTSRGGGVTSQSCFVTSVSAGLRHSAAVTSEGQLIVWGDNSRGQLGILGERVVPSPRPLPTPAPVTAVSCGQRHTVILCGTPADGPQRRGKRQLYGMGDNRRGQLLGRITPPSGSSLVEPARDVTPARLDGPSFVQLPDDVMPARVHCGWTHTIVECAGGHLRGWGRTDYGQLHLPLSPVAQLACGSEHCLALTEDGRLLAWGWDEHGAAAGQLTRAVTSLGELVTSEEAVVTSEESAVMSQAVVAAEEGQVAFQSVPVVPHEAGERRLTSQKAIVTSEKVAVTSQKTVMSEEASVTSQKVTVTSQKATSMSEQGPVTSEQGLVTTEQGPVTSGDSVVDVTPVLEGRVVGVGAGYGCSFAICLVGEKEER